MACGHLFPQFAHHFYTILFGHHNVADDYIRHIQFALFQPDVTIFSFYHIEVLGKDGPYEEA